MQHSLNLPVPVSSKDLLSGQFQAICSKVESIFRTSKQKARGFYKIQYTLESSHGPGKRQVFPRKTIFLDAIQMKGIWESICEVLFNIIPAGKRKASF